MAFTSQLASLIVNVVVNTQRVQANLQQVRTGLNQAGQAATQMQMQMAKVRTVAAGLYIAKNVFNALDSAIRDSIQTAARLEQAFVHIKQAANFDSNQFEDFKDAFHDLVDNLKFAKFEDLQRIGIVASQAGVSGSANILKFTESVAKAAAVSESLDAEGLAKFFLLLGDKFGTGISMTDQYANALGRLAMEFRTNEREIVNIVTKITGTAQAFGLSEAQIISWAAAIRSAGINAERGSGAFLDFLNVLSLNGGQVGGAVALDETAFAQLIKEKPNDALILFLQQLQQYGKNSTQTLVNAGYESKRTRDSLQQLSIELEKVNRAMLVGSEGIQTTADNERKLSDQTNTLAASLNRLDNAVLKFKEDTAPGFIVDPIAGLVEDFNALFTLTEDYYFNWSNFRFEKGDPNAPLVPSRFPTGPTWELPVKVNQSDADKEAEQTAKETREIEKQEKASARLDDRIEDMYNDSLPELNRKLAELDTEFKRLKEDAGDNITDKQRFQLELAYAQRKQKILEDDELKQIKRREKEAKDEEEIINKRNKAQESLAETLATEEQKKVLQLEQSFNNIIGNLKETGLNVPIDLLSQAFNKQFGLLNQKKFAIEGIDATWARLQTEANKKSEDTELLTLKQLQDLNKNTEEEIKILRERLPVKAGFN